MSYLPTVIEEDWSEFLLGNHLAFDSLIKKNYQLLYDYGRKFTRDTDCVKDCIQELFLSLWKNRKTIGQPACVKNYLFKALRRRITRAIETASKNNISEVALFELIEPEQLSPEKERIQKDDSRELNIKILQAISTLSSRQQEIIYLRFYLNANSQEISQIMGLTKQSVYNLLQQAILRLRETGDNLFFQSKCNYELLILSWLFTQYLF